jgi:hypothetical protein
MTASHVISALRLKRAEISGHIHDLEKRIAGQRANLANLDATIRLFSPGTNPDAIPPKRAYRRTRYFAHNELSGLTQDALRTASGPLTSAEKAAAVMQAKGMPSGDAAFRGNRRGAGAYRVTAAYEAWGGSEIRDKPERSMGAGNSLKCCESESPRLTKTGRLPCAVIAARVIEGGPVAQLEPSSNPCEYRVVPGGYEGTIPTWTAVENRGSPQRFRRNASQAQSAGVEEMHFRAWNVALERLRARRQEEGVVFAPNRQ